MSVCRFLSGVVATGGPDQEISCQEALAAQSQRLPFAAGGDGACCCTPAAESGAGWSQGR